MGGLTLDGSQDSVTRGALIKEVKVIKATDLSGTEILDSRRDLAVEMELDVGRDFNPKFTIFGDYKRDENGELDWHSAFVVKDLFQKTGCFDGMDKEKISELLGYFEKSKIPNAFLKRLIGKTFWKIDYVKEVVEKDGVKKARYSSWNKIDVDREKLEKAWKESLEKGYPKNYNPDSLDLLGDNGDTNFNYGANAGNDEKPVEADNDEFTI